MPIENLTDDDLENFVANYRHKERTEGGLYSLAELSIEQCRRSPCPFGTREVAAKILELSRQSDDGVLTYGELWKSFRPDSPWVGYSTQQIVGQSLRRVVGYCVQHKLPIITVLVVNGTNRMLTEEAKDNIYNECKELGVETGPHRDVFVEDQIGKAKALALHDPPDESS
jgi:hypothetical protein